MTGGGFRDLDDGRRRNGAAKNGTTTAGGVAAGPAGTGNGAAGPLNNYSTFHGSDPSVQSLLRTSDRIEQSKRQITDSEEVAKHVLVDLELQRAQLQDMKGMVHETTSMTAQVKTLLHKIADRSYRRKVVLWFIIVLLAIADITLFYLLFIRRR